MSAEQVCERVLALLPPGAEGQVTVTTGRSGLTRFANSAIHQNVTEQYAYANLTVAIDGRVASADANQLDDDASLLALVDRTVAAARVLPVDTAWPGLLAPDDPANVAVPMAAEAYDESTSSAGPDARADLVARFVTAGDGLEMAGYCATEGYGRLLANTAGLRVSGRSTEATLDGIARAPGSDGSARAASARLGELDGADLGALAARTATAGRDAADLEPGRYEVVLGPACVADVLAFLAFYGFNARAVVEGRSFAEVGSAQFDPAVTLVDDATDPRSVGLRFDAEGTRKRRVDLVTAGTTTGLAHDRRTARAAGGGAESTGSAIPGGEAWGAMPVNLRLEPGGASPAAMVSQVSRGLLVTDFWYTRILDPRTQVVTGLTRNGVFLIEGGEVVRPVRNLRFTQSYLEALGPGAVLGVGNDLALTPGSLGGAALVPSLHLGSWNFTGGASG